MQDKNILVVAHEASERAVLKELLNKSSYEVTDFGNSMAAIQWVKQHGNPQLLIIEEESAPLNGLQTMDYLRMELAMEHPVLIVIDRKNEDHVSDMKMRGYLTKPYTTESILEIKNFLDKVPRPKRASSPRHYSLEYLEELGDGNRDVIIESLMIFKESVTLKLEEMQRMLALKDLDEVRKIAHNIKPSFAMLHNQKGRELCNTMMDGAKDLDIPELVHELKLEFEMIQSQLAKDFSKEFG